MATARSAKLEQRREVLEGACRDALVLALRECAGGRWGLFQQNAGKLSPALKAHFAGSSVEALERAAADVRQVRAQLGYADDYEPLGRLAEYRRLRGANDSGEPKLATQFLKELGEPG